MKSMAGFKIHSRGKEVMTTMRLPTWSERMKRGGTSDIGSCYHDVPGHMISSLLERSSFRLGESVSEARFNFLA
jgi:hypothetical protein